MRRIILLRHGESTANVSGDNSDDEMTPLTDVGKQQAKITGRFLAVNYNITTIISSPFIRAKDTATIVANELKLEEPTTLSLLSECNNGVIKGVRSDRFKDIPKVGKKIVKLMAHLDSIPFIEITKRSKRYKTYMDKLVALCGGESNDDLTKRVKATMKYVKNVKTKGDILLVTHNGYIKWMLQCLFNISELGVGHNYSQDKDTKKHISNCSISVIGPDGVLELMMYTIHLKDT